jgi:hypothetical protein
MPTRDSRGGDLHRICVLRARGGSGTLRRHTARSERTKGRSPRSQGNREHLCPGTCLWTSAPCRHRRGTKSHRIPTAPQAAYGRGWNHRKLPEGIRAACSGVPLGWLQGNQKSIVVRRSILQSNDWPP